MGLLFEAMKYCNNFFFLDGAKETPADATITLTSVQIPLSSGIKPPPAKSFFIVNGGYNQGVYIVDSVKETLKNIEIFINEDHVDNITDTLQVETTEQIILRALAPPKGFLSIVKEMHREILNSAGVVISSSNDSISETYDKRTVFEKYSKQLSIYKRIKMI